MSASAWLMLGVTWSVVLFFSLRFFLKVLRQPAGDDEA